jgi:uncharacterized protein YceK
MKNLLFAIAICSLLVGCGTTKKSTPPPTTGAVSGALRVAEARASSIEERAKAAYEKGVAAKSVEAALLVEQVKDLRAAHAAAILELGKLEVEIAALQKKCDWLTIERDKARAAAERRNIFLVLSLVGGAVVYCAGSLLALQYPLVPPFVFGWASVAVAALILWLASCFWSGIGWLWRCFT